MDWNLKKLANFFKFWYYMYVLGKSTRNLLWLALSDKIHMISSSHTNFGFWFGVIAKSIHGLSLIESDFQILIDHAVSSICHKLTGSHNYVCLFTLCYYCCWKLTNDNWDTKTPIVIIKHLIIYMNSHPSWTKDCNIMKAYEKWLWNTHCSSLFLASTIYAQ